MTDEIAELQAKKAKLEAEIEAKKAKKLAELVEGLRKTIVDAGYTVAEVAPLLAPRKPSVRKATVVYRLKSDPSKEYVRGPMPAWMREAIVAVGMDPREKASREMFKVLHMDQEQAA